MVLDVGSANANVRLKTIVVKDLTPDDLNDELDIDLPEEEDYDTVGGFVFSTLGYIPQSGIEFDYNGVHFTIVEAEQRKINRIRIQVRRGDKGERAD